MLETARHTSLQITSAKNSVKKKSFNSAEVAEKAETGSNRMRMKELCGTSSAWEPKVERKKKLQFLFFLYVKL